MITLCDGEFTILVFVFALVIAFVLFFVYPKGNGDFDGDYFSEKEDGEKEYWWQR